MNRTHRTTRLKPEQERALIGLAGQRNISCYEMLRRIIERGFEAVCDHTDPAVDIGILTQELANISVRLIDVERLIDRSLFTTCAGYSYARAAALGLRQSDEVITTDARAAYERQRGMAGEQAS